jgi:hypothetical protein
MIDLISGLKIDLFIDLIPDLMQDLFSDLTIDLTPDFNLDLNPDLLRDFIPDLIFDLISNLTPDWFHGLNLTHSRFHNRQNTSSKVIFLNRQDIVRRQIDLIHILYGIVEFIASTINACRKKNNLR